MAEINLRSRIRRGWNAFRDKEQREYNYDYGPISSNRPDRPVVSQGSDKSIINSIYNRFAVDASEVDIKHIRVDDSGGMVEEIDSDLNYCLTTEANIDQTGRDLIKDAIISMLDEGVVAIVPVDTEFDINIKDAYKIYSLRVGQIIEWRPQHVKVKLYNEETGIKEDVILPKKSTAIVNNPFYETMNEPNSTLKRLVRKLNLLDVIDEQAGSGKLDLIIQLPYTIKTEARREQAEKRRKDIEMQLSGSKYGIAYTDGTEKITQLNRSVENNILHEVEYLTNQLYSELGITPEILNGTATEQAMLNYNTRIIEPILKALTEEMKRKFLTKTARTQKQSIAYFTDPFKFVTVSQMAELGDKFTRNEIMTSNEVRQKVGMKPSKDPEADELRNKNLNKVDNPDREVVENKPIEEDFQNG